MDDITFCMKGWHECSVIRCERHPHNITDKSIPHSYADLYQTGYCPIGKLASKTKDVVEIVRCKDCKYGRYDIADRGMYCGRKNVTMDTYEDDFCSYGERKDG